MWLDEIRVSLTPVQPCHNHIIQPYTRSQHWYTCLQIYKYLHWRIIIIYIIIIYIIITSYICIIIIQNFVYLVALKQFNYGWPNLDLREHICNSVGTLDKWIKLHFKHGEAKETGMELEGSLGQRAELGLQCSPAMSNTRRYWYELSVRIQNRLCGLLQAGCTGCSVIITLASACTTYFSFAVCQTAQIQWSAASADHCKSPVCVGEGARDWGVDLH